MLALAIGAFAQKRIAIFDYDDRLDQAGTIAKIIEADLKTWDKALSIEQFSGKGKDSVSISVLTDIDAKGYDLIILITSDALIVAQNVVKKTPALFTNVNNPLLYGFKTLSATGTNISGATYYVPIAKQLKLFTEIKPDMKRLGFLFEEGAKSRNAETGESRTACAAAGITFDFELVKSKDGLEAASAKLLARGVDALVITSSSVIYDNAELVAKVASTKKIPVFSFHKNAVAKGAIASLSSDYVLLAKNVLEPMVKKVLAGTKPGSLPIGDLEKNYLSLNLTKAGELGIAIPETVTSRADSKL
jgi:putative ABC transport system substrate-binding protein